jgi:hypothetical protein
VEVGPAARYRLKVAAGFLSEARQNFASEQWRACVEHSQLAVENATKSGSSDPQSRCNPRRALEQALSQTGSVHWSETWPPVRNSSARTFISRRPMGTRPACRRLGTSSTERMPSVRWRWPHKQWVLPDSLSMNKSRAGRMLPAPVRRNAAAHMHAMTFGRALGCARNKRAGLAHAVWPIRPHPDVTGGCRRRDV